MDSTGTASNAFVQASDSTAWTFRPGYAYSMEASFEANDVVGNNPVAHQYADPATVAQQVVLDQPIVGTITGAGTYAFYSDTTANDIIPELLQPVGNLSNPSSLTWKVVAQGKVRTVMQGTNRWNLDFPAGTYPSGLYFGWEDTGDSGKGAIMYDSGTASNAFINIGGSSTWTYTPGFAYSMQASFITEAAGLDTPETIAVSSDGNSFVTGDSLGNIATWTKQPQDDGTFQLSTSVGWSLASASTVASGGQVSAVNVALADDGSTQVTSASPGSTGPNSSIVSANGILFGVNAASSQIQYSFDGGTTWQFATVDGSTSGELPSTAAENTAGFPFANDTFDLDGGAASLASNGSTLLVGVPAGQLDNDSTNYYNGSIPTTTISTNNTTQSQGAQSGVVLAFQINADDSHTFEQVFAGWTGSEVQNAHFGSFMAMNGNTALISYQNSLEIWQYNTTVANGWAQQSGIQSSGSLPGANLVFAIDGDTLITELLAAGASTPTVRIYQESGSTWNQTASFPIDPIAVTISGNTASATDTSGILHILKQNAAGVWNDIQDINTATSTPNSTATLSTLSATRPPARQ